MSDDKERPMTPNELEHTYLEQCDVIKNLTDRLSATKQSIVDELSSVTDFEGMPITELNYLQGIRRLTQERDTADATARVLAYSQVADGHCPTLRLHADCKARGVDCEECWIKWAQAKAEGE
jgi:hypothetical protein